MEHRRRGGGQVPPRPLRHCTDQLEPRPAVLVFSESEVIEVRPQPVKRLADLPLERAFDTHPDPSGVNRVTWDRVNVAATCAYNSLDDPAQNKWLRIWGQKADSAERPQGVIRIDETSPRCHTGRFNFQYPTAANSAHSSHKHACSALRGSTSESCGSGNWQPLSELENASNPSCEPLQ